MTILNLIHDKYHTRTSTPQQPRIRRISTDFWQRPTFFLKIKAFPATVEGKAPSAIPEASARLFGIVISSCFPTGAPLVVVEDKRYTPPRSSRSRASGRFLQTYKEKIIYDQTPASHAAAPARFHPILPQREWPHLVGIKRCQNPQSLTAPC